MAVSLLVWGALARAAPMPGTPERVAARASAPVEAPASYAFGAPRTAAAANRLPGSGPERLRDAAGHAEAPVARAEQPFIAAQADPSAALPSLVLPPAASPEPPLFASLMRMGDTAMVRGDVTRARALYERAAAVHPTSSAAPIAAGKTYDPNILSLLNVNSPGLADPEKAREWYERARTLGDPAAASLLAPLR